MTSKAGKNKSPVGNLPAPRVTGHQAFHRGADGRRAVLMLCSPQTEDALTSPTNTGNTLMRVFCCLCIQAPQHNAPEMLTGEQLFAHSPSPVGQEARFGGWAGKLRHGDVAWSGPVHGERVCLHNAPLALACSPWAAHTLLTALACQPLPVTSGRQARALGHQDGRRSHGSAWGHWSPRPHDAASILGTQIDRFRRGSAGVKGGTVSSQPQNMG